MLLTREMLENGAVCDDDGGEVQGDDGVRGNEVGEEELPASPPPSPPPPPSPGKATTIEVVVDVEVVVFTCVVVEMLVVEEA